MGEKHFVINYYKNAEAEIHVQKITSSIAAQEEHSHDYYQIYYISHGVLKHITQHSTSYLIKGDTFIIPPGQKHRICELEDSLFYTFSFTAQSLERNYRALPLVARFLEDIAGGDSVQARIRISDESLFAYESLIEKLYTEFLEKQIGYVDAMRAYATVILTLLARHHFDHARLTIPESDKRSRMLYCMEYIDTNFRENLSLDSVAKWAAMSKADFCKLFRALSGTTFHKYLRQTRIQHAITLMEQGHKLTAIANLCGYNDFSTFYRNFKEETGCSPKQYHKNAASS